MSVFNEINSLGPNTGLKDQLLINNSDEKFAELDKLIPEYVLELQIKAITGDIDDVNGHKGPVNAVAITSNLKFIISGSQDSSIIIWSTLLKKPLKILQGHSSGVTALSLSSSNFLLLSGSEDKTAKLWDLRTKTLKTTFIGHEDSITCVSFAESQQIVLTSSKDKNLIFWDLDGYSIKKLDGHTDIITGCISLIEFAITGSLDKSLKIWNLNTLEFEKDLETESCEYRGLAVSSDKKMFASVEKYESDEKIKLFTTEEFEVYSVIKGHTNIKEVKFTNNSVSLVYLTGTASIQIWNVRVLGC